MYKYLLAILSFSLILAFPVGAAEFSGGGSYSLPAGQQVNENLYVTGGNVNISGNVNGDLFMAGGSISSFGKITKDLNAAGGNVNISGEIGDDLRVAGGNVNLGTKVVGELMVAGGEINFEPGAATNGEVYIVGGRILLRGNYNSNVNIQAEEVTIGEGVVVKGILTYSARKEASIPANAQISSVKFNPIAERDKPSPAAFAAVFGAFWLFRLIASVLLVLALYAIFRRGTTYVLVSTATNFWISLLVGFIVLILLPIAAVLIMFTLIGIPVSIVALLTYINIAIISRLGAGALAGVFLFKLFDRRADYRLTWVSIIVGSLALAVVELIPILGWLVSCALFLALFGRFFWLLYLGMRRTV